MKEKMITLLNDNVFRTQAKIAEELFIEEYHVIEILFTIPNLFKQDIKGTYSYIRLYGFPKEK